ncbi:MAG: hypothetical protein M3R61_21050, partial [Chloroflexota bacterium]|nr:hypothetical protein [Chloroflexota bacterium]
MPARGDDLDAALREVKASCSSSSVDATNDEGRTPALRTFVLRRSSFVLRQIDHYTSNLPIFYGILLASHKQEKRMALTDRSQSAPSAFDARRIATLVAGDLVA